VVSSPTFVASIFMYPFLLIVPAITISPIFLSIGMDAQTGCFDSIIETSLDKYFSSKDCKTSLDGIFVAGDCREKKIRQLTTAVNDGTIAATLVIDYLK